MQAIACPEEPERAQTEIRTERNQGAPNTQHPGQGPEGEPKARAQPNPTSREPMPRRGPNPIQLVRVTGTGASSGTSCDAQERPNTGTSCDTQERGASIPTWCDTLQGRGLVAEPRAIHRDGASNGTSCETQERGLVAEPRAVHRGGSY